MGAGSFSPEAIMVFVRRPAGSAGGEYRLYATRTLPRAEFTAAIENYAAGWNLAARMTGVLIRDGDSYGECLSWVFTRWENEDRDKPALEPARVELGPGAGIVAPAGTPLEQMLQHSHPYAEVCTPACPAYARVQEEKAAMRGTSVNPTPPCGSSEPPEGRELWFCQDCREFHEVQTQLRQLDPARLPGVTTVWSKGAPEYRTRTGVVLTDHELQRLADEAERGYCAEPDHDRPPRFLCRFAPDHGGQHSWELRL
jgi:hypothetical protein